MWCDSILTADENDAESMRRQVHSTTGDSGEEGKARVAEATDRTTRWLDRCIGAHSRPHEQNLFAIVQVQQLAPKAFETR